MKHPDNSEEIAQLDERRGNDQKVVDSRFDSRTGKVSLSNQTFQYTRCTVLR